MSDQDTFLSGIEILDTSLATSSSGSLYTYGGISILNTNIASDLNNGGSFLTLGGISISKNTIIGGDVNILSTTLSTNTSSGSIIINGGMGINGNIYGNFSNFNNLQVVNTSTISNLLSNNIIVSSLNSLNITSNNLVVSNSSIQNSILTNISSNNSTISNLFSSNITSNNLNTQLLNISSTINSISTTTGSLIINGGLGINQSIFANKANFGNSINITNNSRPINLVDTNAVISCWTYSPRNGSNSNNPAIELISGTAGTASGIGNNWWDIYLDDSDALGFRRRTNNVNTPYMFINSSGNVGIGSSNVSLAASYKLDVGGNLRVQSTNVSINYSTGALVVNGGVGIGGDLFLGGNLFVGGSTVTIKSTTLNISDNIIVLNAGPSGTADAGTLIQRYQVANNIGTGDIVTDTIAFSGVVQTGTTISQVVLPNTANLNDDFYTNYWIKITSGSVGNNIRQISSYIGSTRTLTLATVFTGIPISNTDTFNLYGNIYVANYFKQSTKEYILSYTKSDNLIISDVNYANLRLGKLTNDLITTSNVITTNASIGNATVTNISAMNITTGNINVTGKISILNPVNANDAVTKSYVDNIIQTISYKTISIGTTTANTSTSDALILNMSLVADIPGTYAINFNCEYNIPDALKTVGFSTATATSELNLIYNDIIAIPQTGTHALVFGSGETLFPGVYVVNGAVSIAGNLTLDGQGNSNSVFVIRSTAALNTGASTTVILSNGTQAKNVYLVAQDAIGLGAGSTVSGIIFSNSAAIAVGANCVLIGVRLFTKSGAIAVGPGTTSIPPGPYTINFRSLNNFVIFTGSGGIANTGVSTYTGDISTNLGAITGFETATVNGTIYQAGSTTTITRIYYVATFSLYVNDIFIPYSDRTKNTKSSDVSLQGIKTVIAGDTIQIKYRVDNQVSDNGGIVNINNRIMTINRIN